MNVIPFPGTYHYANLDPELVTAVRRMWRRPESTLNQFAPNVDRVLHQLNEQARFEQKGRRR